MDAAEEVEIMNSTLSRRNLSGRKTKVTLWSSEKIEEINYGNDHSPAIGLLSISSGVGAK
jgi:hypothetical protein